MKRRSLLALLTLAFLVPLAHGQTARDQPLPRYRFERLTAQDGLPENTVLSLLQDRSGFLWFGAAKVVRYDGRSVEVVKPRAASGRSSLQYVGALVEDSRGDLWAGGGLKSGLWRLDRRTRRWTAYKHAAGDPATLSGADIGNVVEAAPGRILVLTNPRGGWTYCLDRLDVASGQVRRFRLHGASANASEGACFSAFNETLLRSSLRDRRGLVWIGTNGGLLRYDARTDSVTHFPSPALVRYGAERFRALDAMLRRARPLAVIARPGDIVNLTAPFRLSRATRVLLVGGGEMHANARADAGWLEDARGRVVWSMRFDSSAWTGSQSTNRLSVATRVLPPGAYRLRFGSDDNHSAGGGFTMAPPEHADLWGVRVVAVEGADQASALSPLITGPPAPLRPGEMPAALPFPLAEDAGGVWIGRYERGLIRWDARTGHFRQIHAASTGAGDSLLERSETRAVLGDPSGVLWVGTNQGLLRVRDPLGRRPTATRFTFDPAPQAPLNDVQNIVSGEGGTLWLGTDGGLVHLDPSTGQRQVYPIWTNQPDGLGGAISRMLRDRQGNLWIGTHWGGLHRLDRTAGRATRLRHEASDAQPFPGTGTFALAETPDGVRWAVTDSGFVRLARGARTATRVSAPGVSFVTLLVDRTGGLWASGHLGAEPQGYLFRLDPRTGRVLERFPRAGEAAIPRAIRVLSEGPDGTLWLGTDGVGVMRFDPATERLHRYPVRSMWRPGRSDSLSNGLVSALLPDRSGMLWIGTIWVGVERLDVATGRFTSYHDPVRSLENVTMLHEDRRGRLWFGTITSGLFLLDRRTGAVTNYGPEEGLPHYHIESIVEDAAGMLWLNTPVGICRFDPDGRTFRTFGPRDGVPSIGLPTSARLLSRDGQILLGGAEGLLMFTPRAFSGGASRPMLSLDALTFRTASGQDSTRGLSGMRRLDLPFNAADVTITFTGFDYARPDAVRYQYRLRGLGGQDEVAWTDGGTQGTIRYAALPPGDYRFEVRAAGADGLWSAVRSVRAVVHPPWWRTWWAYVLYALAVAGLLVLLVRAVRRRAQARERERAREQELAQAKEIEAAYTQLKATQQQLVQQEKLASLGALTAGIAHEIKNPLNFVNNFASLSRELVEEIKTERSHKPELRVADVEDVLVDLEANVARIEEHGRRADGIVKNMLMHARSGSGRREPTALNALVEEAANLAYHGMRAQRAGTEVELALSLAPSVGAVDVVPQEISRVVLNLVGNALYAVAKRAAEIPSQGDGAAPGTAFAPTVRVSTHATGDQVEIQVWDNGGGIPDEVRARIFEPFFTTKPAGEGTGLGLSLAHDIVAAHGGTLSVESRDGETTFTLALTASVPVVSAP